MAVSLLSAQSPWVRKKGGYYAQLGYATIPTAKELFYTGTFTDKPYILNRAVSEATIQLYGEYGITKKLTALIAAPFVMTSTADSIQADAVFPNTQLPAGSLSGLGNIQLGAKYKLSNKLPISFNLVASLPTASNQAATGLRTGFDAVSVSPSLSAGLGTKKSFVYANLGGTYRTNSYSTNTFLKLEGGRKFGNLYAILVLDLLKSQENGTYADGNSLQTGLSTDNQSWTGFGLKLNYEFKERYGITLWGFGASGGNLVQKSPSIGFSIYAKSKE